MSINAYQQKVIKVQNKEVLSHLFEFRKIYLSHELHPDCIEIAELQLICSVHCTSYCNFNCYFVIVVRSECTSCHLTFIELKSTTNYFSRKIENGWVYGETSSDTQKSHSRLKPYNMLNDYVSSFLYTRRAKLKC